MSVDENKAFLTRVAWLYHVDGLTQDAVAKALGETRLRINQALRQARQDGIVRIEIASPFAAAHALQDGLTRNYGLRSAFVGVGADASGDTHDAVAAAVGFFVNQTLRDEPIKTIGITWGSTLDRAVRWLSPANRPDIEVVSLLGGLSKGASLNTFGIAANFARTLGAQHFLFAAPIYADSPAIAKSILGSGLFREQLDRASGADVTLLSAGDISDESHLIRDGLPDGITIDQLKSAGAVGDVLGRFLDQAGKPIDHPLNDRLISVPFESIRDMKHVALAAGGKHKLPIIRAALHSGLVHTLVTDEETARALMNDLGTR